MRENRRSPLKLFPENMFFKLTIKVLSFTNEKQTKLRNRTYVSEFFLSSFPVTVMHDLKN